MRRILAFFLVSLLLLPFTAYPKWYKGNTHTHTVNSDGDSSPDEVARWYKEQGYNFVVITDHNFLTPVDGLNMILAAQEKFLVMSGEEVSDKFENPEGRTFALHLNAINLGKTLPPTGGSSVHEVLQTNLDSINAAGALGQINHPNFHWSINAEEMYNLRNCRLFEVWNTSTDCNNTGGGGYPGTEVLWDSVLTRGKLVYAVASDDAHEFKLWGPQYSNPGGGFVRVRADSLEAGALVAALERGDFYSSTGVTLKGITVTEEAYTVEFAEQGQTRHTVYFIGRGGKVLATAYQSPAVYRITGKEGYVRAKIVDSNGRLAWTQPVFTNSD